MKRKDLWFYVPALVSLLAVIRLAMLPLGILYGKIPDPETSLLLSVLGRQVLPILGPSALMIVLAWRIHRRSGPVQRWVLLLVAAPVIAFAMMFYSLEWGP